MRRSSGLLLHPTSLPGGPCGTLGAEGRVFVDFLAEAGQRYWQMLPIGAPDDGGSPYMSESAFGGSELLIDRATLESEGVVGRRASLPDVERVDFRATRSAAAELLEEASAAIKPHDPSLEAFCEANESWLSPHAHFVSLLRRYGGRSWTEWDLEDQHSATARFVEADIHRARVGQFLFWRQWASLKSYANDRGIGLVGDVPIFVSHNSADVWGNREIFQLDAAGRPAAVAGVPPDYFSPTGQLWGNPLYDWGALAARGYSWWIARFEASFDAFDRVRVDHFRGFDSYWRIPADAATAIEGRWDAGPGRQLFDALAAARGVAANELPILVEDLGIITAEVEALRDGLGLPGMKVLQFAFDGNPNNPHHPRNLPENAVVYTGTHDNDTTAGWLASLDEQSRRRVLAEIGCEREDAVGCVLDVAWRSSATLAIAPVQDVARLGSEARMNVPGTHAGNWAWRMPRGLLTARHAQELRAMTLATGR